MHAYRLIAASLAGLLSMFLAASARGEDDGMTMRDLVRRYNKDKAAVELKNVTGLDVEHVLALEHTILLTQDGQEVPVIDADKRQFNLGDQIRVRIRAMTDAYLYIFHEGADGQRTCLLPDKEEKPPFVKAGQTVDLPTDGTFEFVAPPGKEILRVIATEKPTADLGGLLNAVFKKQDLTPEEQELKKSIRAKIEARLQSISSQQAQTPTMNYRGLLTKDAAKDFRAKIEQAGADEVVFRELPSEQNKSTFTMVAGSRRSAQPLLVTIPLQSIRAIKR